MGARRQTARAVVAAAVLCAGARAWASVQVEPIARLSLEGGYDSNVLYDGKGGNEMGRVSPDLGLHLRDHTWSALAWAGGDLLMYPQRGRDAVWNQRGQATLNARLSPRLTLDVDGKGTYAFDPIGLARLGIFAEDRGAALAVAAKARLAWRLDHEWTVAGSFDEHLFRFSDGSGAASHTPALEATRRLGHRLEAGAIYKLDLFQNFGAQAAGPAGDRATAHEAAALVRWRWTRRLTLEADAGPAVFSGAAATWVLPQAGLQLLGAWRAMEARASLRHGVGLGVLATPGLFDSAEGAVTLKLGPSWLLHADGGVWRSGAPPWGADAVIGYGIEGEVAYRITRELRLGLAASRFARADIASSQFDRNVVGLRMSWELRHR
jgi:hypothetical protein